MLKKSILFIFSLILILGTISILPVQKASSASPSATLNGITKISVDYYPAYIPTDGGTDCTTGGTPFAVRATVEGNVGDNFTVKIRLGTNACVWSPVDNSWKTDSSPFTALPRGTIGTDGKARIWLFGRAKAGAMSPLTVRGRTCNADWTSCPTPNVDSSSITISPMDMSTSGAWLEEYAHSNIAQKIIVIKDLNDNNKIVGMYMVENNNISEGYASTSGYYKVSVHTSPVNYQIEAWDPNNPGTPIGQVNTFTGVLNPGTTTTLSFPIPTNVKIHSFKSKESMGYVFVVASILLALSGIVGIRRRR